MSKTRNRTIRVAHLARVEGEGALHVKIRGGEVDEVRLEIFEPPRFFEAFLRGRKFTEAPDITARICGICPVAYQLSAIHAMEQICDAHVPTEIRALRHLIYCGEWIESHALHIFMLHLPDFLGYDDAILMAREHPQLVKDALRIKKTGNEIMRIVGGREIHPINLRVGGFYRVPTRKELISIRDELAWSLDRTIDALSFAATLTFPHFEQDYEFVALQHPLEYPILSGRLWSSNGLDISIEDFTDHFYEEHVSHSTALHGVMYPGGSYMVGPMARYNLNYVNLAPIARAAAEGVNLTIPVTNPFKSILVRLVEMAHVCAVALDIIDEYCEPDAPAIDVEVRAGTGFGCTEAPRGICWHRYTIDEEGTIQDARIVPPTAQNQKTIESDLRHFVAANLDLPDDDLRWQCEQTIRNYDPCISCACHFLQLHIDRDG
jgi:sulfhydrogenase subunit alpha